MEIERSKVHCVMWSRRLVAFVNAFSYGLTAFCVVAMALIIMNLFFMVGLGPRHFSPPFWWQVAPGLAVVRLGIPSALLVGIGVLVGALDPRRIGTWSYRTALAPIPVLAMAALVAVSYRLLGLATLMVAIPLYVRYARGRGSLLPITGAVVVLIVTSASPYDVSLQNVPGGPHVVPAVSGLLTDAAFKAADRGEVVVVGGCGPMYNEPGMVVVW